MNKLDKDYQTLVKDILDNGTKKSDRTGTGTKSVFSREIRHKMSDGFPLLTTKKMHFKSIVTELLWFLRGDTNITYLVHNNCNIWNGDAYKRFTIERTKILADTEHHNGVVSARQLLEWYKDVDTMDKFIKLIKEDIFFAEKWGDLGPIYGKQWRKWEERGNIYSNHNDYRSGLDQLAVLINDLKHNPDSRRLMVTAWNPSELATAVLPPCHYGFQCWTKELTALERLAYYRSDVHGNGIMDVEFESGTQDEADKDIHKWLNRFAPYVPQRSLSLMWNQRSVDTGLGLPYNIASYGLLLMLLAKTVNMIPDELIGSLGDTHVYLDQIDAITEQLDREPFALPTVKISDTVYSDISEYTLEDITLSNYQSHEKIKLSLSN